MSNFAGIKKQGAGCIWDWPYPLTNVSNVIRDAIRVIFQGKSIRSREIRQHIMQAMFSYNALSSLKKSKYSQRVLSIIPRNFTQKKRPY